MSINNLISSPVFVSQTKTYKSVSRKLCSCSVKSTYGRWGSVSLCGLRALVDSRVIEERLFVCSQLEIRFSLVQVVR